MPPNQPSLRVGLLDNACHSLQRGYEQWSRGQQVKDGMLLKEAVIWVHHGTELALKQLLVQSNEYLVFENVDSAIEKLDKLRKRPGMANATVLDLFEHGQGAFTVGFAKLIERVAVMLGISELAQGANLRQNIDELATLRNKLVHFSVTINVVEVASLLSDILDPLLNMLNREVSDSKFRDICIPEVRRRAQPVQNFSYELAAEGEKRVSRLLQRLGGEEIPGEFFGTAGPVQFPLFKGVSETQPGRRGADLEARGDLEDWIVEIKLRVTPQLARELRYQLEHFRRLYEERTGRLPKVWLVALSDLPPVAKAMFVEAGILVSTGEDLARLESLASGLSA